MKSLKELYRIGRGPSSSHTIGPERACKLFLSENTNADEFTVVLYESLAKTGEGHGTGSVIKRVAKRNGCGRYANENTASQYDGLYCEKTGKRNQPYACV